MRTVTQRNAIAPWALLLSACIGVQGQTPEIASMKDAEAEERARSGEVDASLGAAPGAAHVNIDVGRRYQKLEGFGAATAWYMDMIVGPTTEDLYEFLFPELGLDILRFRNRFERTGGEDAKLQEEVEIFERATKALGHPPKLLLSAWSPPGTLKANGKEKCKSEANCTLKKVEGHFVYEEYADWWVRSLAHYQALGLTPDYVSMQNEPSFVPPDWEGCQFEPTETDEHPGYGKALAKFHARLGELNFKPQVLGPETLGIHYDRTQNFLKDLDESLLDGIAHHLYERGNDGVWDWRDPGPQSYVDEMRRVAQATRLPLYQTEFHTDDDRGVDGGFETAWLIHSTMAEEGAVAFFYWDLIWPSKGLVSMQGRAPSPRDQYYAMKHFARFTDPGYERVSSGSNAEGLLASAYVAPDEQRLTVVLLNTTQGVLDTALTLEPYASRKSSVYQTTFRPGKSKRWEELGALGGDNIVKMPARSVVTVVFER